MDADEVTTDSTRAAPAVLDPRSVLDPARAGGSPHGEPAGQRGASATAASRADVTGWGRATASRSSLAWPADDDAWHRALAAAGPRGLIPRGAGSGYGDAAQNAGGVVAHTTRGAMIREIDPDAGTVAVDAGVLLGDLMRTLVPAGWALPVMPGTSHVTVGGAIAADVHGKNHPSVGTFGAHVAQMTVLTPALGPVTMSPTSHAEEFWATVGGLGLTGVIRRAQLRLRRLTTAWMLSEEHVVPDLSAVLTTLADGTARGMHSVAWIDAHRRGRHFGAGIVSHAREAAVEDLPPGRRDAALTWRSRRPLPIPRIPGPGILIPPAVAATNRLHLAATRPGPRLRPLPEVLHPLDAAHGWPGLYGRRGLIQYQFVVPVGAEDILAAALALPLAAGCPATLAVLKTYGESGLAPLSFPAPGWSLALDFPASAPALAGVLDDLDERVAAAGGRVYLVKDSRLRPDLVAAMYPGLASWRAVRTALDPDRVMTSDLARRLRLIDEVS
jgi:decaprenylphospho-beta-D-ribofuranose 2-oxidase